MKVAEKAREHQAETEEEIEVEEWKAAELKKRFLEEQQHRNGRCVERRDTETTEGTANSKRSLNKPDRLKRRIPQNENMSWRLRSRRLSRLRRKPSLQLRLLTERNKLHATKSMAQVASDKDARRMACRSRRPSAKDAQEVIQLEQVDFEQVAVKRQTASQAKNDTNLAKQSGEPKNTQHNVK